MVDKPYQNPEVLKELHHEERLNLSEIARKFNVVDSTIHYHFNKHGIERRPLTPEERFHESYEVDAESGCWIWQKRRHKFGYGEMGLGDRKVRAHRYSYQIHKGEPEEGSFICHKCNNPACVNPDHLYEGSPQSNADDAVEIGTLPHEKAFSKGEKHQNSKLTEEEVVEIRKRAESGVETKLLSEDYGVEKSTVRQILRGDRWSHAEGPIRD